MTCLECQRNLDIDPTRSWRNPTTGILCNSICSLCTKPQRERDREDMDNRVSGIMDSLVENSEWGRSQWETVSQLRAEVKYLHLKLAELESKKQKTKIADLAGIYDGSTQP